MKYVDILQLLLGHTSGLRSVRNKHHSIVLELKYNYPLSHFQVIASYPEICVNVIRQQGCHGCVPTETVWHEA